MPVNRKMHCLSPCLHYAFPAALRIAAHSTCQNFSKLSFPPCLTQGQKNSFGKFRPADKYNKYLEQKCPTDRQQTNFPNGAKAFAIERKQMSVRLDWLWTKWLWNSSGCGYDRYVPQVILECRFGVSTSIGVESFGSDWWSPLFRIF